MSKLLTLLLLTAICVLVVGGLYDSDLNFDGTAIEERDSIKYVEKSVDGNSDQVVYGESRNLEDGSANMVSSIVVNYRSFDTLGEVSVLFIAALGVTFLLGSVTEKMTFKSKPNFMLRVGSRMIFGFLVLLGAVMMSHGHLTPGGGFPGGSLIAGAFLLLYFGDPSYRAKVKTFKIIESTMGTVYILIGIVGLITAGYFLNNFLDTGLIGHLFSAGILPIVYVVIGLKVGSELIGLFDQFMNEEVAK